MHAPPAHTRTKLWRAKYPTIISSLLSVFQMILTLVIVGCEIGGDFIHFTRMNIFVGYWTLPLFMCAWISLASASCCCRSRCCGTAALVFQFLAIPMALCVIGFDGYFLNNPTQCFFSNDCPSSIYNYNNYYGYYGNSTYDSSDLSYTSLLYQIKVPLIKGQLAAGVLMFVVCVSYIIIFIVTNYRVKSDTGFENRHIASETVSPRELQYIHPRTNPIPEHSASRKPMTQPSAIPMDDFYFDSSVPNNPVTCHNCRSIFQISTEHY